jgi:hypothetical protein
MNSAWRLLACTAGLVLLAVGAYYTWDGCTAPLDFAERDPDTDMMADRERQRRGQLDGICQQVQRRTKARDRVVTDLIEKRITLFEAAAHFRVLDATLPGQLMFTHWLRKVYPGRSDEERLCNRVIDFARRTLADQPRQAAVVVERLQAQLRQHLEAHSSIDLPPVAWD